MFSGKKLLFSYISGRYNVQIFGFFLFLSILASLCCCSWYIYVLCCTVRHIRLSDHLINAAIRLSFCSIYNQSVGISSMGLANLINYRMSDQGLNLSDYRISDSAKPIGWPALERKTKNVYNWYQRMVKRLILASLRSDNSDIFLFCWRDRALTPVPYTPD